MTMESRVKFLVSSYSLYSNLYDLLTHDDAEVIEVIIDAEGQLKIGNLNPLIVEHNPKAAFKTQIQVISFLELRSMLAKIKEQPITVIFDDNYITINGILF